MLQSVYPKRITLILLLLLTLQGVQGQSSDSCRATEFRKVQLYIPGSIDTVQANGLQVKAVDMSALVNGFELRSPDSSVHILGFQLAFDNQVDGNLYVIASRGNRIVADEKQSFPLHKIGEATLVTIDHITYRYKNVCYKAEGQAYLKRRE